MEMKFYAKGQILFYKGVKENYVPNRKQQDYESKTMQFSLLNVNRRNLVAIIELKPDETSNVDIHSKG